MDVAADGEVGVTKVNVFGCGGDLRGVGDDMEDDGGRLNAELISSSAVRC